VWETKTREPQFAFWSLIFAMELAILTLIRSFRPCFVSWGAVRSYPYFMANNNSKYSRWPPIHLRDMMFILSNSNIHKWPDSSTRETSWYTNRAENFQQFPLSKCGCAFALDWAALLCVAEHARPSLITVINCLTLAYMYHFRRILILYKDYSYRLLL